MLRRIFIALFTILVAIPVLAQDRPESTNQAPGCGNTPFASVSLVDDDQKVIHFGTFQLDYSETWYNIQCFAVSPSGRYVAIRIDGDAVPHFEVRVFQISSGNEVWNAEDYYFSPVWDPTRDDTLYVIGDSTLDNHVLKATFSGGEVVVGKLFDLYAPFTRNVVSADGMWLFNTTDNQFNENGGYTKLATVLFAYNIETGQLFQQDLPDLWQVIGLTEDSVLVHTSYYCSEGIGEVTFGFPSHYGVISIPFDFETGEFSFIDASCIYVEN